MAGSRTLLKLAGATLSVAATIYCIYVLYTDWSNINIVFTYKNIIVMLACGVLLGLTRGISGLFWALLITTVCNVEIKLKKLVLIFGLTNIFKYLPTNTLHYVGRFAYLKTNGLSAKDISLCMVLEVAAIVSCIVFLGLFGVGRFDHLSPVGPSLFDYAAVLGSIFYAAALFVSYQVVSARARAHAHDAHARLPGFLAYNALQIGFRISVSVVLYLCIVVLVLDVDIEFTTFMTVWLLAWLVGYLTPGAPAGIGVREVSMVALLVAAGVDEALAAQVVLLARVLSTIGDVLWAMLCSALWSALPDSPTAVPSPKPD